MASLVELREEIAYKRRELHEIFEAAGSDMDLTKVTTLDGDTATKAAEIRRRNDELSALGAEESRLAMVEMIGKQNDGEYRRLHEPATVLPFGSGGAGTAETQRKSFQLKQFIKDHPQYKALRAGQAREASIELPFDFKTLVTLTTVSPQNMRQPDPVLMALEERTVADLLMQGTTDRGSFEYYEETTFTNTAAVTAEGDTKPEMTLAYTLRTETVRKIAETIPATKEALDDVSWLESQLRGRLAYAIKRAEETEILTGSGSGIHLTGLINRSGIQTQAKGSDPTPDAVYKAMQKVRGASGSGFAEPTAFVVHPNDWTDIKLLRTADGLYIWGNPSDEGPDRIWGLPVRQTTAITEGTGLVGAFRPHAEVVRREGLMLMMSTEHSTFAAENKVLFIAEERLGLAVYRPSAFCTCTGI